jgi:DNA-binding transcriptional MerR regulator
VRIGALSELTGVSARSLRYYEERGLLASAARTPGGQREYPPAAVDRVILVQQLFAAGLHSDRIRQILPCMRAPEGDPNERATAELARALIAERDRIDATMTDLLRSRALLEDIIVAARDVDEIDRRGEVATT